LPRFAHNITPAALHSRAFRLYWIALILSAIGTWMQIVAQSLLVLRLSHGNAAALGIVALAQAAAFLVFALFGGSFADRIDRRRLLLATQSILMIIALGIGLLVALQSIRVWMIVIAAFLSGVVLSFDQPARAVFLPSLVPDQHLASAISLQSIVFTGAAAVAPLFAGLSIARFGFAGNYFFNAASYLAAIAVLLFLGNTRVPANRSAPGRRLWLSIHDGIVAVKKDRVLTWAVSGYAVLLFAAPSMQILLPVIADRVLRVGATSLGFLFAAFGAGSIAGALLIARLTRFARLDRVYLCALAIWICAMPVIAASHRIGMDLAALVLLGAAQSAIATLTIFLLQSRVAKEMRGRMMSLQTLLNMGIRPLGDFPLSLLIATAGTLVAAGSSAALIAAFTAYLALTARVKWNPAAGKS
jgi:MFS family permease